MKNDKIITSLKNMFFNVKWTCNACGNENFNGKYFCNDCLKILPRIEGDKCEHCGRKTAYPTAYCNSCREKNIHFDEARSIYEYKEPISNLIMSFKYEGNLYLAETFSEDLANIYFERFYNADFITFVPMTKKHYKERGYNQAEILSNELSKVIGVEVKEVIEKVKETERQATLNAKERKENLRGAFKVNKKEVENKTVLLIDDVLTTGSTLDVLSEKLKQSGAKAVYCLTIASVQVGN